MGTSRKRAEKYWRWLDKHVASVVLVALTKKTSCGSSVRAPKTCLGGNNSTEKMQTEEILAAGSKKSEAGGQCMWLCSATCQEYCQGNILPCSTSERCYFINLMSSLSLLIQLQYCRSLCSRGPEMLAEVLPPAPCSKQL